MTNAFGQGARAYRLVVPNAADAPKLARDHVARLMTHTGHPELAETARLLVSECVTNVYRHTGVPRLAVSTTVRGSSVRITVFDGASGQLPTSRVRMPAKDAEHGRGLALLGALAAAWGATWRGTWFELRDGG